MENEDSPIDQVLESSRKAQVPLRIQPPSIARSEVPIGSERLLVRLDIVDVSRCDVETFDGDFSFLYLLVGCEGEDTDGDSLADTDCSGLASEGR